MRLMRIFMGFAHYRDYYCAFVIGLFLAVFAVVVTLYVWCVVVWWYDKGGQSWSILLTSDGCPRMNACW